MIKTMWTTIKKYWRRALMCLAIPAVILSLFMGGMYYQNQKDGQEMLDRIKYSLSAGMLYAQSSPAPKNVQAIYHRLLKTTNMSGRVKGIRLMRDKYENAFAAYDGHVYVTQGLLDNAANENELALVIGHEIAHVLLNHVTPDNHEDNRANEMHSDKLSAFMLLQAGFNLCEGRGIYVRWYKKYGDSVLTSSHPSHVQRFMYLYLPRCGK